MKGFIGGADRYDAHRRRAGSSTSRPCRPDVWMMYSPSWMAPLSLSTRTTLGKHVVGDGQQQQVTAIGSAWREWCRQQVGYMGTGCVEPPAAATTWWPAASRAAAQDGADATRADHAYPQPGLLGQARVMC